MKTYEIKATNKNGKTVYSTFDAKDIFDAQSYATQYCYDEELELDDLIELI